MDPNYREATQAQIEEITRPQFRTIVHYWYKKGLADYARSLPPGHSIHPDTFSCSLPRDTPYGRERNLMMNACTLAYMMGYNKHYLDNAAS